MKKFLAGMSTSLLMMLPSTTLFSQDTLKTYLVEEVVVTATRLEKNPADVGRSITVVKGEHIRGNVYTNIGEILTQQVGTYVVGAGQNPGMSQSIFMRGAASNQTIVLVDDIPVVDPSSPNRALEMSELSFSGLDRLEVVRGSHSTLYGSSAIGGVVNLITQKNRSAGIHVNAGLGVGTFGRMTFRHTQEVTVNYSAPEGFYLNTHLDRAGIKGLDATLDTVSDPAVFKNRDRDNFEKQDLLGKVGFNNANLDLYISFKSTRQKTDIDKRAYIDDDNSVLDFRRNLLTYGGTYTLGEHFTLKFVGGFSSMKRSAVDDSSIVDRVGNTDKTYSESNWKGTTMTNEFQVSIATQDIEGVVGVGVHRETMGFQSYFSSNMFGPFESRTDLDTLDPTSTTSCLFTHIDFRGSLLHPFIERYSLGLGLRYNQHSIFGSKATFAINPTYRLGDFALLYISFTTGFNAPSLYHLYTPEKHYLSGITRGNIQLQPETSKSFELGFKHSFPFWMDNTNRMLSVELAYFRTVVDNSIAYVYLWDKNIGIDTLGNDLMRDDSRGDTYLNIGRQISQGAEFSLRAKLSEQISISGNVSLVSGRLEYLPSEIPTAQTKGNHVQLYDNGAFVSREIQSLGLVRRPNTFNLSFTYAPTAQLSSRADLRHVGARNDIYYDSKLGPYGALGSVPVADYTIVDFSQTFHFSDNIYFVGRIENILNTRYSEINGFATRGRGFYLKTQFSF